MSASPGGKFQDHYVVLGVEPNAEPTAIQAAYSKLAHLYHPNNKETGNKEKFDAVAHAYEVLSDPMLRKAFDDLRPAEDKKIEFSGGEFFEDLSTERERRLCILCLLYDRRRYKPATGSLSQRLLEGMLKFSPEQLQLSLWYLRQRGYVVLDDKSNLQISVEGMEFLEEHLPSADSIFSLLKATREAPPAAAAAKPISAAVQALNRAPAKKPV
ncbi:MAG: DnaJ domain-containing protein [Bryobacter sp.]|jgi:curved DNA-binding protein CbpA|nr:DnaJ domain-containing protein [Bryobacter sp.]